MTRGKLRNELSVRTRRFAATASSWPIRCELLLWLLLLRLLALERMLPMRRKLPLVATACSGDSGFIKPSTPALPTNSSSIVSNESSSSSLSSKPSSSSSKSASESSFSGKTSAVLLAILSSAIVRVSRRMRSMWSLNDRPASSSLTSLSTSVDFLGALLSLASVPAPSSSSSSESKRSACFASFGDE